MLPLDGGWLCPALSQGDRGDDENGQSHGDHDGGRTNESRCVLNPGSIREVPGADVSWRKDLKVWLFCGALLGDAGWDIGDAVIVVSDRSDKVEQAENQNDARYQSTDSQERG